MSTIHAHHLEPDAVAQSDATDPTRRARQLVAVALAAAAAPLLVMSNVAMPALPHATADAVAKAAPVVDRVLVASLLSVVASLLFIPFTLVLWRVQARRGAWLRFTGGALLMIAMAGNALGQTINGYFFWAAQRAAVDPATQVRLLNRLAGSPWTLPISATAIPLGVLGVLMLATGVLRSRVVAAWAPWALIIGTMLSATAGVGVSALLGTLFAAGGVCTVFVAPRP